MTNYSSSSFNANIKVRRVFFGFPFPIVTTNSQELKLNRLWKESPVAVLFNSKNMIESSTCHGIKRNSTTIKESDSVCQRHPIPCQWLFSHNSMLCIIYIGLYIYTVSLFLTPSYWLAPVWRPSAIKMEVDTRRQERQTPVLFRFSHTHSKSLSRCTQRELYLCAGWSSFFLSPSCCHLNATMLMYECLIQQ